MAGRDRADPALVRQRIDDGHVEPVLIVDESAQLQPIEQSLERGAAAHRDVLPVVERDLVIGIAEAVGLAAGEGTPLEQHRWQAGFDEVERGGESGQAAADHRNGRLVSREVGGCIGHRWSAVADEIGHRAQCPELEQANDAAWLGGADTLRINIEFAGDDRVEDHPVDALQPVAAGA